MRRASEMGRSGEILISQRFRAALRERIETEEVHGLQLKGFTKPVDTYRVLAVRP